MVDFKLTDGSSPVLFTVDGYQLVVMPMLTAESKPKQEEAETTEPEPETEAAEPATEEAEEADTEPAEAEVEAEAAVKADKPKRSHKKKEPVAVA